LFFACITRSNDAPSLSRSTLYASSFVMLRSARPRWEGRHFLTHAPAMWFVREGQWGAGAHRADSEECSCGRSFRKELIARLRSMTRTPSQRGRRAPRTPLRCWSRVIAACCPAAGDHTARHRDHASAELACCCTAPVVAMLTAKAETSRRASECAGCSCMTGPCPSRASESSVCWQREQS
jgi:hypothetical protein